MSSPSLNVKKILSFLVFLLFPALVTAVTITDSVTITGLTVTGALSKGSGSFLIDHPLDPKNKLLYHSFVESPDVKNIYDGIATLDEKGEARIELPNYFLALNKDFRFLGTAIGVPSPNLYLKESAGRKFWLFGSIGFTLAGGTPGTKVSWQVTGIRHDPYILKNPIVVEVEKGEGQPVDKGEYIFPEYEQYESAQ